MHGKVERYWAEIAGQETSAQKSLLRTRHNAFVEGRHGIAHATMQKCSAVVAAVFNAATVIFHDPLESPAQKRAIVAHILWDEKDAYSYVVFLRPSMTSQGMEVLGGEVPKKKNIEFWQRLTWCSCQLITLKVL